MNIKGNEFADMIAKITNKSPTILINNYTKKDIQNLVKIKQQQNNNTLPNAYYKKINPLLQKPTYPTNFTKQQQKMFTRLRLGHSKLTHEYILKNSSSKPACPNCGNILTMDHLLSCFNKNNQITSLTESIPNFDYNHLKKHLPQDVVNKL